MIEKLFTYLLGEAELYVDAESGQRFASVIAESKINARIEYNAQNGGILAKMRPADAKKIAPTLDKLKIIVYINSVCGLKSRLLANYKRVGLLLGVILFFTLLSLSTLFVFKIEISGSELITHEEIKEDLSHLGIRVGVRLNDIDKSGAASRFLAMHPEFSWASVSFKGTTVCLELKEKTEADSLVPKKADFLVAGRDGVVKSILVYSGKKAVSEGTAVKKGDLLINGYISGNGLQYSDDPRLRFDGASGSVKAEIRDFAYGRADFCEVISKTARGKRIAITVSVFGKEITFGKVGAKECEKSAEKSITVFDKIELPITYTEYFLITEKNETHTLDEVQGLAVAKKRAYEALYGEIADGELTEISEKIEADENGITVTLEFLCVTEIAVPKYLE